MQSYFRVFFFRTLCSNLAQSRDALLYTLVLVVFSECLFSFVTVYF